MTIKELWKRDYKSLLFGFFVSFFSFPAQTSYLAFFNGPVSLAYGLESESLSILYGQATLLSAVFLPFMGGLVDRWSPRRMIFTLAVGYCLGMILLGFPVLDSVGLFFAYFLIRLSGQVSLSLLGQSTIARIFGKDRELATSLTALGKPCGEAILPIFTALLLTSGAFPWQVAVFWVIPAFTIFLLWSLSVKSLTKIKNDLKSESRSDQSEKGQLGSIYKSWAIYFHHVSGLFLPFLMTGLFYSQIYFRNIFHLDLSEWAVCFSFFAVAQVSASLFAGFVMSKTSASWLIRFCNIPTVSSLILLNSSPTKEYFPIIFFLFGFGMGLSGLSRFNFVIDLFGSQVIGRIKGIDYFSIVCATAIAPLIFNKGLSLDKPDTFLLSLLLAAVLCLVIQFFLGREGLKRKFYEKQI